jgi:hypothetical protein
VPSMNRVKFTDTTDRNPDKDGALDSDFPCVRLVRGPSKPHAFETSNSCLQELVFMIQVYTGDKRVADDIDKIDDLDSAIFKAFTNWKTYLPYSDSWTWGDIDFRVRYCRASMTETEITNNYTQRSQDGWESRWTVDVDLWFATSDLQA